MFEQFRLLCRPARTQSPHAGNATRACASSTNPGARSFTPGGTAMLRQFVLQHAVRVGWIANPTVL